jgi:hypothetical protein
MRCRYFTAGAAVALSGFIPFKVLFLFASENAFAFSSSCVLEEESFPKESFSPCTLEYQRAKRLARL